MGWVGLKLLTSKITWLLWVPEKSMPPKDSFDLQILEEGLNRCENFAKYTTVYLNLQWGMDWIQLAASMKMVNSTIEYNIQELCVSLCLFHQCKPLSVISVAYYLLPSRWAKTQCPSTHTVLSTLLETANPTWWPKDYTFHHIPPCQSQVHH